MSKTLGIQRDGEKTHTDPPRQSHLNNEYMVSVVWSYGSGNCFFILYGIPSDLENNPVQRNLLLKLLGLCPILHPDITRSDHLFLITETISEQSEMVGVKILFLVLFEVQQPWSQSKPILSSAIMFESCATEQR